LLKLRYCRQSVQFSDVCSAKLTCDACRGLCHSSRFSAAVQDSKEEGRGEEGAVGAIVEKLCEDLHQRQ